MNLYNLGQTVYYIIYEFNMPILLTFTIVAIRETADGYSYSKFIEPASPYKLEGELFATIQEAVDYQIALLNALVPV